MIFHTSFVKLIQSIFQRFGIYVSKKVQWNGFDLIYEIHENYLKSTSGILHIGGHWGQESSRYHLLGKKVIWIEPLPNIYSELISNISVYPKQKAICVLLGDKNRKKVAFYYANNNGASSSLFSFDTEANFDKLEMIDTIYMEMKRLDSILTKSNLKEINHWVIDVQGAELIVLRGAGELLEGCQSIFIEISRRNIYKKGSKWSEIKKFLNDRGFVELWNPIIGSHSDVLFVRKNPN